MYVKLNIEARSRNHCCRVKAIIITYPECVFIALVVQYGNHIFPTPYYSVICGLSDSTIFFHTIS
jgi:hypothetical protein